MTSTFADLTFRDFLTATAAKSPTPGGGAVASAVGALSAALGQMVVAFSRGKKNLAAHEPALERSVRVLENARALMLRLADEDAQAYGAVNELSKLPEGDPRRAGLKEAEAAAVQVPLSVIATAVDLLRHCEELAGITNRFLRSDLAIAAVLAEATARASWWNVAFNTASMGPDEKAHVTGTARGMLREAARLMAVVEEKCAV